MNESMVGKFALENRLSSDNTGSVYRAIHVDTRRMVALKLLPAPLIQQSSFATSEFAREIDLLKALRHPNIARCFGGALQPNNAYLVHEMVEGETLKDTIARRGSLGWETALDYARQICSGLQFAHETGMTHLDLLPDKIIVTQKQQIKLVDFRLDRPSNNTCTTSHQMTHERVTYLSPEQVSGQGIASQKSDLYSLGCLIFEMLTARPPFKADTTDELIQMQIAHEPPQVSTLAMDCPVWLDMLIAQLLEKDPMRRPFGASAVLLGMNEAKTRIGSGMGMAEHATLGFSPLQNPVDRDEAKKVLKPRVSMRERFVNWWNKADRPPIYQNIYFLIVVLFVLVAGVMFALTPPSEKVLFERAEVLMKSDDPKEWREARTYYLEPMLKRFPNGKHAEQAREYMDKIEIDVALKRMKFNARLGRDPKTDGERLYAEAWRYEQFGDAKIAMQKYQALKAETSPDGKDRPFLLLAEQRMDVLEESGALNTNHEETILALLDDAEKNAETGDMEKAREIWRGIILLYANDKELFPLVERAKNRLRGERAEAQAAKSEPTESTGEQSNDL